MWDTKGWLQDSGSSELWGSKLILCLPHPYEEGRRKEDRQPWRLRHIADLTGSLVQTSNTRGALVQLGALVHSAHRDVETKWLLGRCQPRKMQHPEAQQVQRQECLQTEMHQGSTKSRNRMNETGLLVLTSGHRGTKSNTHLIQSEMERKAGELYFHFASASQCTCYL